MDMIARIKILHLEDLPSDADLVAFELRRAGLAFERRLVDNRADYIRSLQDFDPDIVLSDHSLPSFDSLEALAILKESAKEIPFILITATVSEEFAVKIMKEGAVDYILKDRMQRLPGAMENALEKYRDLANRKLAETRLLRSEANLRSVFENTDQAILLMDIELLVISFNSTARKLIWKTLDREIEVGEPILQYFPKERIRAMQQIIGRVKKGETIRYETAYEYQSSDAVDWYDVTWTDIRNPHREHVGFILTLKDITQRKQEERERDKMTNDLIQRNKDLEQFAYIVSHNLRAPVANILGLSNLLDVTTPAEPEFWEVAGAINTTIKHLDQVIIDLNQVLQVSSHINDRMEHVSLTGLIKELLTGLGDIITRNETDLQYDFDQVDKLMILKSYLYSIFQNLIVNSIKYRRPGIPPVIRIRSRYNNGLILLLFEDNGKGIDLKRHGGQLFGLYKRFDTSVEGKGMGLFMVKAQVEALGGKIGVQSELNSGTTFLIEIPQEGRNGT